VGVGAESRPVGTVDKEKLSDIPFHTKECTKVPLASAVSEQSCGQVIIKQNVA
jgi:hypothetical protein